jgi:hypothetical protein
VPIRDISAIQFFVINKKKQQNDSFLKWDQFHPIGSNFTFLIPKLQKIPVAAERLITSKLWLTWISGVAFSVANTKSIQGIDDPVTGVMPPVRRDVFW